MAFEIMSRPAGATARLAPVEQRYAPMFCFALLTAACALASFAFACATPFAAFAVVAAAMLPSAACAPHGDRRVACEPGDRFRHAPLSGRRECDRVGLCDRRRRARRNCLGLFDVARVAAGRRSSCPRLRVARRLRRLRARSFRGDAVFGWRGRVHVRNRRPARRPERALAHWLGRGLRSVPAAHVRVAAPGVFLSLRFFS